MPLTVSDLKNPRVCLEIGQEMYELIRDLFPICRSITGNGVRATLRRLQRMVPLSIHEVPTGTTVFDWKVPKEWNIRDAYIKTSRGERVVDFNKCNLHVVSYSVPVKMTLALGELKAHLFSLPEFPDWIPYRTSYYEETWGFCLSHNQLRTLEEGEYEVCIDSTLESGHLSYGECFLPGTSSDEVLISCHVCHPSLCNDNLSGIALATFLARHLQATQRQFSYRFLFIPGTIGAITWLNRNEDAIQRIKHGFVVAGVGDPGSFGYKKSRYGNAMIDRVFGHVLEHSKNETHILEFSPYGYDERQFCSPGINLPVGCIMRTQFGRYSQYHTSADNLEFIQAESLADSFQKCLTALDILEHDGRYLNLVPKGEPQLGRRGLYGAKLIEQGQKIDQMAMLWVLNQSDGDHSLLDIAARAGLRFEAVRLAADALLKAGLLRKTPLEVQA